MLSRRTFLGRSAAAGFGLALSAEAPAIEPIQRPGTSRLRLSLAAYSFRDFFKPSAAGRRITLAEFIDYCADHGCEGTELTSYYFPPQVTPEALLDLRRRAFLRGLAVSGTAVGNNFARPPGPEWDREVAGVKQWIDHAAVLGAPHIRVFAGDARGLEAGLARRQCIQGLEECGAYAAAKGIWLGLENHGGIVAKADDLLEIVRAVQCPYVGVNLDTGNFYGPGDPYDDMARLAPYAVNVQVKVEINRPGSGKEPADLSRIVRILRQVNYQGFVALEYEAAPDPWTAVPEWLKRMREAFGRTG
ncbi:MAG TPA: sugar phosphate isomerase/epimerase family protein [Verrucomicrobiota bacterium]|nr:sugar phosphate isomerase/epimerase family protein [Verrucomicrobiota bacterium]HNU50305.1 sugar phosphate isomerase/epimerase family protein [Verrucomicrobiota bacterium]